MFKNMAQSSETEGGLAGAIEWIANVMTGPLATIVATLAIAAIGLALLQGRLAIKGAGRVVAGCFILFGAPYIAKELASAASHGSHRQAVFAAPAQQMPDIPAAPPSNPDPYAGASMPMR